MQPRSSASGYVRNVTKTPPRSFHSARGFSESGSVPASRPSVASMAWRALRTEATPRSRENRTERLGSSHR